MVQKKSSYSISGYRYAPESFRVYKGAVGGGKKEIPLSDKQRSDVGYLYLTRGFKAAVDYVKRVERERERKCRLYTTYGFLSQEEPGTCLFCKQIRCREDAPVDQRLAVFREIREYLDSIGGRVEQSVECELDGRYRPIHMKQNYLTADFDRPVMIRLIVT